MTREEVRDGKEGTLGMTGEIAVVCLGWRCWRHWIPAPASAGVMFFRGNDGGIATNGSGSPFGRLTTNGNIVLLT